jgi:hypothetical protein
MAKAWSADGKGFAICQQMANSLSETQPAKATLPSAGRWQRGHVAATCATWESLGWPIWSLCHLPADGKELAAFAVCQQMASMPLAS